MEWSTEPRELQQKQRALSPKPFKRWWVLPGNVYIRVDFGSKGVAELQEPRKQVSRRD